MDEIDSIGSSRIESGSGGDSEVQRTMLELLNQLDGFEATKNIKVSSVPAGEGFASIVRILPDLLTLSLFPFVSCRWLWPRIVSTSWTPLYCDPAALIERSNSHHQTRRLDSTFSKFTRERWIWLVASTYERLPSSCPALPERKSRFISLLHFDWFFPPF